MVNILKPPSVGPAKIGKVREINYRFPTMGKTPAISSLFPSAKPVGSIPTITAVAKPVSVAIKPIGLGNPQKVVGAPASSSGLKSPSLGGLKGGK